MTRMTKMITITEKNKEKELFGNLKIGDYYLLSIAGNDKILFIKTESCYGINLMNGNNLNFADSLEIIPVKNVTIEYEV